MKHAPPRRDATPRPAPTRIRNLHLFGWGLAGLWLCLGLARSTLAAETNAVPTRQVSLQDCFKLALEENLDLKIERINPPIARLDLELARAGYDPAFTFKADHSYSESGGDFRFGTNLISTNLVLSANSVSRVDTFSSSIVGLGPYGLTYDLSGTAVDRHGSAGDNVSLKLTQPLLRNLLVDQTRLDIAVARNRVKFSELGLRQQIITIITAVEQAYYELIFARENVQVQTEGLRLAERLSADDKKRVQIGMIPRLDEKQSESQVAARQADLSAALRSLATAQNTLKQLITSNYRELHDPQLQPTVKLSAEPQSLDLHDSWEKGLTERPDLQQAKLDVERQGITLKYYKNQRLPALDVSGTYGHGASGAATRELSDAFGDFRSGDKPFWGVGAVFSIPLGNKFARERYRQGRITADQLVLKLKQLEESVLVEIDEAVNAVRTTLEQVQSTAKARTYAEEALAAEQKKLDSGKSTSFVVLQLQRDLTSARSNEIRALADYNKALAELYKTEGTTLERRKINLQVK